MSRPPLPYRKLKEKSVVQLQGDDVLPVSDHIKKIRKKLKRIAVGDSSTIQWLDTGFPELNAVMGSQEKGIPFGRVYEISGMESHGKTALALEIAGMAQRNNGAAVTLYDAETTFDVTWAKARGLNVDEGFHLIQPYMVKEEGKGGESRHRLLDSGELFHEVEELTTLIYEEDYKRPQVVIVDSIASLIAPEEAAKHVHEQTMRETTALSRFLSRLLRRWTPLVRNQNIMMICINQLREKPGFTFGDPRYTPGGKSLPFYSTVRVRMARVRGGKVLQGGKMVGAKGVITNTKNKAGHGSVEGHTCGFKIYFAMTQRSSQYVPASSIKRDS